LLNRAARACEQVLPWTKEPRKQEEGPLLFAHHILPTGLVKEAKIASGI
jgi:hypothetical protein